MPNRSAAGKKRRRWQRIVGNEEEADEEDEDEDEDNNNDNIEGVVREKFGGDAHRARSPVRRGKEDGYAEEEAGEKDTLTRRR